MKATITKSTGLWYNAIVENGTVVQCRLKGKLRLDEIKSTNPIAVGDNVILRLDHESNSYIISEILDRNNYIIRLDPHKKAYTQVIAANIDQALIVATANAPRTSDGFINRLLIICEAYHITPIIILNKIDIYTNKKEIDKINEWHHTYTLAGYKVIHTSIMSKEGIADLHTILKANINLLCGHSGVGKSSLMNIIYPSLGLKVGPISAFSNKGKHTTTFAEWHTLPDGGAVIDTPGVKEFGLANMEAAELGGYLPEIRRYMINCKFTNCTHRNEPHCAVISALEQGLFNPARYDSYISMMHELEDGLEKWEKK